MVRKNKIDEKENEMNKNFLFVSSTYIKHNLHFVLYNFFSSFGFSFFFLNNIICFNHDGLNDGL